MSAFDPDLQKAMLDLVVWLGWAMFVLGVLKMIVYALGEFRPGIWDGMSGAVKKFMTGKSNRWLFGLGGLLTALFGIGTVGAVALIRAISGF